MIALHKLVPQGARALHGEEQRERGGPALPAAAPRQRTASHSLTRLSGVTTSTDEHDSSRSTSLVAIRLQACARDGE